MLYVKALNIKQITSENGMQEQIGLLIYRFLYVYYIDRQILA